MDLAPASNGHIPPDPSYQGPEPDSDRSVGSVAELNQRLKAILEEAAATKATVSAEADLRRKNEAAAEASRAHIAHGLLTLGNAVTEARGAIGRIEQRLEAAEARDVERDAREADRDAKLMLELSKLNRQDSIHDADITQQRAAVKAQATAMDQLRGLISWRNGAKAVVVGVLANAHHIAEAIKTLMGH